MIKIQNTFIGIHFGDITELEVDAIVNPANTGMIMNTGVGAIIKAKGGSSIEENARGRAPIRVGEAIVTDAGKLKAKYIIHAASMAMDLKTDAKKIAQATTNSLLRAEELQLNTIAFPAIGTGIGNYPPEKSAEVMIETIVEHLRKGSTLKQVTFAIVDDHVYHAFSERLKTLMLPTSSLCSIGGSCC